MDDMCEIWEESASRLQERSHLKTLLHDAQTTDACIYKRFTYKQKSCNAVLTAKGGVCIAVLTAKGGVCIAVLTAKVGV